MKKLIGIIMAVMLAATVIVGCGKSDKEPVETKTEGGNTALTGTVTTDGSTSMEK